MSCAFQNWPFDSLKVLFVPPALIAAIPELGGEPGAALVAPSHRPILQGDANPGVIIFDVAGFTLIPPIN